jgi:uncharacterized OB-fold protein
MTLVEMWAAYEQANLRAHHAYRIRGCPDCGDIVFYHREGSRCVLCRRRQILEVAS